MFSFFIAINAKFGTITGYNKGIIVNPVVGPEAITGSSRMKGGSATKILLETILLQAHFTLSKPTSPPASILNELLKMFESTYSSTYLDSSNISGAVKIAAESLQVKGHVYYIGFGLSGFMGLLDASECVPTFGAKFSDVRGFLKGGYRALKNKEEELQLDGSNPLLISLKDFVCKFLPELISCDTVVFICPDVKDIQEMERISQLIDQRGAQMIGIIHENEKHFSGLFMKSIVSVKQPSSDRKVLLCNPDFTNFVEECLTEISVKWILNAISTGAHVLKGKVVGSFMIDVKVSNNKLFYRAVSIISKFARVDQEKAWCAVLQSIYRTEIIDDVLDKLVSEHVARGTVAEQVVPVAVLLATKMFTVESALEVLKTKTVSYVLRNLAQS